MLRDLSNWLDQRTGYRKLVDAMLLEHVPGGARWRYVWGSCLAFVFGIQVLTGVLLMLHYSPGDVNAWGSVYFIQYEMDFGWLIRGLHHFGSQTMVVLLALHMLQVVLAGAQLPPREFNWWIGLGLLGIVLGLSLTGYLLPWDQKGFYATQVATNIASGIPFVGGYLQRVVVGGPEYGNHTLTQFFTLHVGILPPLAVVLIVAHLYVFRRHGVTAPANAKGFEMFWPGQAFKDLVACVLVFAVMMSLVIFGEHGTKLEGVDRKDYSVYEDFAKAGQKGWGANLDAPADRETPEYPARPEWYFLFLFQLLKYFQGDLFLVGTVYIPNGVMVLLFVLPLLGYGRMRPIGRAIGILVMVALLGAIAGLTFLAIVEDADKPLPYVGFKAGDSVFGIGGGNEEEVKKARKHAEEFHKQVEEAEVHAKRAVQLAHDGIPVEGAALLLRRDPLTQGPRLFQTNCAGCHSHDKEPVDPDPKKEKPKKKASNLTNWGSYDWVRGLLKNPGDDNYFGRVKDIDEEIDKHKEVLVLTEMIRWRKGIDRLEKDKLPVVEKRLGQIAYFVAEQAKPRHERNRQILSEGRGPFIDNCYKCHGVVSDDDYNYKEHMVDGNKVDLTQRERKAPDLSRYGSAEWLRLMIMSPAHKSRYGWTPDNLSLPRNYMTAFRPLDGPAAEVPFREFLEKFPQMEKKTTPLPDIEREILIRWLINDNRIVVGGTTISAMKK